MAAPPPLPLARPAGRSRRPRTAALAVLVAAALTVGSLAPARAEPRCQSTLSRSGGRGLFELPLASPGCAWQLYLGLWGHGFSEYGYLLSDDHNTQFSGGVQIGATLGQHVETWLQVATRASRSQRPSPTLAGQPSLALGRTSLGVKLHAGSGRFLHSAVQAALRVHSGPDDLGPNWSSIDASVDLLGTVDLRAVAPRFPLRLHGRIGYLHDRSSTVLEGLSCSTALADCLATRLVYTAAYSIGQPRVLISAGADVRFSLGEHLVLGPVVSYQLGVATEDGDVAMRALLHMLQNMPSERPLSDRAIDGRVAQTLTLGAWLGLPLNMAAELGLQIGLSSYGYAQGEKTPQLCGYGTLSWALGLGKASAGRPPSQPPTPKLPTENEVAALTPGAVRVRGVVRDAVTRTPLPDAIVRFVDTAENAQLSGPDGAFKSGPLPPGPLTVEASRGDHQTARVVAVLRPAEGAVLDLALLPLDRPAPARLFVELRDESGAAIEGQATLYRGNQRVELSPQGRGLFGRATAGPWHLRVDAPGSLSKETLVTLSEGSERRIELPLTRRPLAPRARLGSEEILLSEALVAGSKDGRILPASTRLLDEVADLLLHHPEVRLVRIEVPPPGPRAGALEPQPSPSPDAEQAARAELELSLIAIRDYLIQSGVDPERLVAGEAPAGSSRLRSPHVLLRLPSKTPPRKVD